MSLDLDNARYDDQKEVMRRIMEAGESPFLPKNLPKYHPHPIIKQGKYWYITKNNWPYAHARYHYLIIAKQYWTKLEEVTPEAMGEVIVLARWLRKKLDAPGGAIAMRFGDQDYSGASVDHLHWQFMVPEVEACDYERIKFSVGKKKEKLKK
jgi:diadenosine tetraphosphate (Ap4A) HIT family hydrolase